MIARAEVLASQDEELLATLLVSPSSTSLAKAVP